MAWAFDMSVHKKQKRIIRHRVWPGFLLAMLILSGCQDRSEDQQAKDNASGVVGARLSEERLLSTPDAEAIGANNRAVGLMGRFEYGAALGIFSALVKKYPHWRDVKLNLAIATLNRQRPGDEQAALALADEVLGTDPEQPRAHYIAGLLRLYLASPEQAIGHFARVVKQDPDDAYAAYYLGQCLAQQSKPEKALDAYRRALDIDPYLRSAAYGAFQALQRLRRKEEARGFIEQYQRLATNPRARLAEFKYTRMGSKAEALALNTPTTGKQPLPPPPHGPIFADKAPFPVQASAKADKPAIKKDAGDPDSSETSPLRRFTDNNDVRPVSMTVMDLESDGQRDLFVAGAGKGSQHNLLLSGTPDGRFVRREDHPLTGVAHVNAVLWGDFDNDGHLDAYLCRQGANQLWRNDGKNWLDVTATTDTWNGTFNTVDGAFFDADHDGDLDIFLVNEDGPNGLLYNNRDGTFRTDNMGERTQNRASLAVIPADLDRDRDTDIIVLNRKLPHEVYINDRLWAYHGSPNLSAFESRPALSATVGDLDSDGLPEIYTLTPEGELIRWSRDGRGDFAPTVLSDGLLTTKMEETWARMTMLDADGDGVLELLIATPNGWSVMSAAEPTAAGWWGNPGLIPRFMAAVPDDKLLGVT
ncbi:MAG: VCBS repeat-containing protein, partial [Gammaproteobacteria bacterium]|nr:VCBS repeat-containing protein [Gammaproteobacteria bacterium]